MRLFKNIRRRASSYSRNESGLLSVDAIIIFPMVVWFITSTFTFFDGFRQSASNLKAAYTIGDLISRETETVTDAYVESMHELMVRMVDNGSKMNLRVTFIRFDEEDDRHYVRWSSKCGYEGQDIWKDSNIELLEDFLPPMPDQDTLILVETSNPYVPLFSTPLFKTSWVARDRTFKNFVFTRPRFTTEIDGIVSANAC